MPSVDSLPNARHVVHFSGGAGSWAAAKRVAERHGVKNMVLLCSDTGIEADDWYPFVLKAAEDVGAELVMVKNERFANIWEKVYHKRSLPSVMRGWCAQDFKIQPQEKWIKENCDLSNTLFYFGFDWSEIHRLDRIRKRNPHKTIEAPLVWEPMMGKTEVFDALQSSGLPIPKAYTLGISHNNCLKTGCFKQGAASWRHLLRVAPEIYAEAEHRETDFRHWFTEQSSDPSWEPIGMVMLHNRTERKSYTVTLAEFRERIEAQQVLDVEPEDYGSCLCVDD